MRVIKNKVVRLAKQLIRYHSELEFTRNREMIDYQESRRLEVSESLAERARQQRRQTASVTFVCEIVAKGESQSAQITAISGSVALSPGKTGEIRIEPRNDLKVLRVSTMGTENVWCKSVFRGNQHMLGSYSPIPMFLVPINEMIQHMLVGEQITLELVWLP